ncbi:MAG: hypothetical protein RBG13Loki_2193 [Promethearchaeota archaeon CR_4]|nr:MAG: hypothetical protein RBG13Loki_2193 [Candidatus Lokiarchaeota archaeon CR_4]
MVVEQNITFKEREVIDLYLVLVEKNDELLEKMLNTKDLAEKKEYIKKSLKLHDRMEILEKKLGLNE